MHCGVDMRKYIYRFVVDEFTSYPQPKQTFVNPWVPGGLASMHDTLSNFYNMHSESSSKI